MTTRAIHSRSFPTSNTPAVMRLLKELFQATPLYLVVASLQRKPGNDR